MSLQSIADVLTYVQTHPDLPPTEVFVLLVIANYANQHGANAYPTLATLQKTTHLSRRTIRYALRGLEEKKLVETELVRGRTGRQTYRLLVPHTPLRKGATVAPFNDGKGATDDTKKGHVLPLELLLTQQGEKKERAHAHHDGYAHDEDWDNLPGKASRLGISPGSPLWPLMTTPPTPKAG
jgi:DNA-binding transcriptional ArsR family regulator